MLLLHFPSLPKWFHKLSSVLVFSFFLFPFNQSSVVEQEIDFDSVTLFYCLMMTCFFASFSLITSFLQCYSCGTTRLYYKTLAYSSQDYYEDIGNELPYSSKGALWYYDSHVYKECWHIVLPGAYMIRSCMSVSSIYMWHCLSPFPPL